MEKDMEEAPPSQGLISRAIEFTRNAQLFDRPIATPPTRKRLKNIQYFENWQAWDGGYHELVANLVEGREILTPDTPRGYMRYAM